MDFDCRCRSYNSVTYQRATLWYHQRSAYTAHDWKRSVFCRSTYRVYVLFCLPVWLTSEPLFVCIIVSCDTSETNVTCSPRWIVHPQTRTHGARYNKASTLRQCLRDCVVRSLCVTAEWIRTDRLPCWLQNRHVETESHPDMTQYEIIRECATTSGAGHHGNSLRSTYVVNFRSDFSHFK